MYDSVWPLQYWELAVGYDNIWFKTYVCAADEKAAKVTANLTMRSRILLELRRR
jgi:hypothetical protein